MKKLYLLTAVLFLCFALNVYSQPCNIDVKTKNVEKLRMSSIKNGIITFLKMQEVNIVESGEDFQLSFENLDKKETRENTTISFDVIIRKRAILMGKELAKTKISYSYTLKDIDAEIDNILGKLIEKYGLTETFCKLDLSLACNVSKEKFLDALAAGYYAIPQIKNFLIS